MGTHPKWPESKERWPTLHSLHTLYWRSSDEATRLGNSLGTVNYFCHRLQPSLNLRKRKKQKWFGSRKRRIDRASRSWEQAPKAKHLIAPALRNQLWSGQDESKQKNVSEILWRPNLYLENFSIPRSPWLDSKICNWDQKKICKETSKDKSILKKEKHKRQELLARASHCLDGLHPSLTSANSYNCS